MMITKLLVIFLTNIIICKGYLVDPGPVVKATVGEVWPRPKDQKKFDTFSIIRPSMIRFNAINHTCDILEKATARYMKIIRNFGNPRRRNIKYHLNVEERQHRNREFRNMVSWRQNPNFSGYLDTINIDLKKSCDRLPYLGMDESYSIRIQDEVGSIESYSIWGILRGLETFSQMLVIAEDSRTLKINSTIIEDEPRFIHRGLLLDTSRHYMSLFTIYQILDGMSYNKLNVFHWHIVDDHSFPYESIKFPELSEQGAYHPTMVYTQEDVRNVIEYARVRGIRVISEFDTPGHTRSWGVSHPEILTTCEGQYEGKLGPIDPTKQETYTFMNELLTEIVEVFPDKYVHLGGDEVGFECWKSSQHILEYMKTNNISTFEELEEKYIHKIVDKVNSLNASLIVWQEVYENGVNLPSNIVVQIWTGDRRLLLTKVTSSGFPALLSSCWYLDHLATGGDWQKYYDCDPHDFVGSKSQKDLVWGGEACMWSESVDNTNVLQRVFPRLSAVAEKLWSHNDIYDIENARKRLEENTCRLITRGIPAQPPNGPGFCA